MKIQKRQIGVSLLIGISLLGDSRTIAAKTIDAITTGAKSVRSKDFPNPPSVGELVITEGGLIFDFGGYPINKTSFRVSHTGVIHTFWVKNQGSGKAFIDGEEITSNGIGLAGNNTFLLAPGGDCKTVGILKPKESCSINIKFIPSAIGPYLAEMQIPYHNGVAGGYSVRQSFKGAGVESSSLLSRNLSSSSTFNPKNENKSKETKQYSIVNLGNWSAEFGTIKLSNPDLKLVYDKTSCGSSIKELKTSESCTLTVQFTPSKSYNGETATLSIVYLDEVNDETAISSNLTIEFTLENRVIPTEETSNPES